MVQLAPEVDLRAIAGETPGFAGTGLANVINEAALLAARAGKTAEVGLLTYDQPSSPFLPGVASAPPKTYSEHTAQTIDAEVGAIEARAHERVRQILGAKKGTLELLARWRLVHEVLEGRNCKPC